MSFALRPFDAALAALRATKPGAALHSGQGEHYDAEVAYSFESVGEWSHDPPVPTLYRMKNPLGYSDEILADPKVFVDYANFGGAVGTWNANGSGRWCASPGEWILVDVELVQEQAEQDPDYFEGDPGAYVYVVFALWRTSDGWAAAVWPPSDVDALAAIIGLDGWPAEGWQPATVWYGE